MTKEELFKFAYRCCEAKLRKSGPVFSEAEIMEDFPEVESDQPRMSFDQLLYEGQPIRIELRDVLRLG